jgi:translation initiation factor RLI1
VIVHTSALENLASRVQSDVPALHVNVDELRHRPLRQVAALLPDMQAVDIVQHDLRNADINPSQVRVLYGEEGARILDRTGTAM